MKTKHPHTQNTPAKRLLIGYAICLFSFLSVLLLSSILVFLTKDPLSNSDRFSPLIFAAAGVLAGVIGKKLLPERLFLFCPALLMLTALLLGIFLSGGHIALSALLSEGIYLAAAILAFSVVGAKRKHKRHRH